MKLNLSLKSGLGITSLVFFLFYLLGVFWSFEPSSFDVREEAITAAKVDGFKPVVGYTTTTTLIKVSETLLNKPGGYLSNDVLPPSVLLDNIPAWEFGALEMVRDLALAMRQSFSRSQSQSLENQHLKNAQPKFNIDAKNWAIPSAEGEYASAIDDLYKYRRDLADPLVQNAQFYARTDNLRDWLREVEKRLGGYSQRLSSSVGRNQLNTDLAGERDATQSTFSASAVIVKTSWWKTDDVFYEARGASWALLHMLQAIEVDFADVLETKNATVSLSQIIRELEATQSTVWSPMILNGSGFGTLANHSLVMANYISRANAAIIDLRELLSQG
ncbi:DUF2333 family protein [Thalassomonas sp. M1454]|uniref:DUF2333 family protein n=1 Tax=Thalassomonas sp. M1454 TaxID=2594477 RepID=UPI00117D7C8C|nr:DUF2333 family protein [Thalassomonas sp. M1454]TRX53481.1 DUF2333 family protein [Thalassomonas sp. M1454]